MAWHLSRAAQGRDIVHLHMPDPMAAAAYWMVRPKGRLVVHWHSDVIRQQRMLKVYEPLQEWLLERADAVIATSPPYAETSRPLLRWRDKVTVVPIGVGDLASRVDPQRVAELRARYGGRSIVLALGRMAYYKGLEVLIDAAASLPQDWVVLLAGHGKMRDTLVARTERLGLQGRIEFPGAIDDADLANYHGAADIFCLPSTIRAEAYGVAMLEAMSLGKPIVACDIPGSGVPWVNVDGLTGFNVPAGDPAPLAAALQRIMGDPELRRRLGGAARERVATSFTGAGMTTRTLSLYQRLITS
jgi:rhamnosyl/mannosyltransferase